ncbi:MAG: tRNA preQ1(34) S-adenosylmethionine ribosyltransferase-isomerase QueA [Patescibacteria group bacterium]|nr:tRNA preQ1(34) S-adenosylmethionine ribosyltransferase-isomerase QueA [Patescibacteria group bacterium]
MRLQDFDYNLPPELIAQQPVKPRDYSRLLLLDKKLGQIEHKYFYDLPDYLEKGDVLVLNNSKVFPARLLGKKKETGGKIEVFLHRKIRGALWQCLIGGRGAKAGLEIEFDGCLCCRIIKNNQDGTWNVRFNKSNDELMKTVFQIGQMPLPPYIKRGKSKKLKVKKHNDKKNYQTVYADDKKIGSVAAPTAGFHFTSALIKKLKAKGVQFEYITLHVGLGTFAPVKVDDITKHKMHAEYVEVKSGVIKRIAKAKSEDRRIIAVGTTSVRTLEAFLSFIISSAKKSRDCRIVRPENLGLAPRNDNDFSGWVNIFIYPGYKFKIVDAMITNFHLPKSTLLMLASAFAGKANIDKAYKSAIKHKYRFYSYGDAMLIV